VTSCTSRMFISWRLSNASSIAILVGDVMPFVFKVAILIEAIRSNCGWEWARGRRWLLYFVLIRLRYSRSTPRPFPSYSSAFFQFYLFISGWGLSRIVRFMVFVRRVCCAVRGHCVLVVKPPLYFRRLSPFPIWCLLHPACLHAVVAQSVWLAYRQMPSFLRPPLSLFGGQYRL